MSIKHKLLLTNIASLLIPSSLILVLALIISYSVSYSNQKHLMNESNGETKTNQILLNIHIIADEAIKLYENNSTEPSSSIISLENSMLEENIYILVVTDNKSIYMTPNISTNGTSSMETISYEEFLSKFDEISRDNFMYLGEDSFIYTNKYKNDTHIFAYSNRNLLKSLTLEQANNAFLDKYFVMIVVAIILLVILSNLWFAHISYKSIITPLNKLTNAAIKIQDGDLNTPIYYYSSDEFGHLCDTFNDMRLRLRENIEQKIQEEENRKELITNISHDLRTPITTIKGYVEGLLDKVADTPQKQALYLRTIYGKANEMSNLINDLFLYSKLDINSINYNLEYIKIASFVQNYYNDNKELLFHNEIETSLNISINHDLHFLVDKLELTRVFNNILHNSINYKKANDSKLIISVYQENNNATICFVDNGIGIKKEDLHFIFNRFYRSDPSRNNNKGGSGLGLAIAKLIVDDLGGNIWIESTYLEGTACFIQLPIKSKEEKTNE